MRAWFDALEARERGMVMGAAAFLAFAILYLGLWMPLDRGQEKAADRVVELQRAIGELRPLQGLAQNRAGQQQPRAGQNQSLVVIIDSTLRQRELYSALQRSQPTTANGIRVEFENVAFDDLMLWLGDLSSGYGMRVQSGSFSVGSTENPGRVNSSLTLER